MSDSLIPLIDLRSSIRPLPVALAPSSGEAPIDSLGRALHDLRISVTDRCNFRCTYCMPREVFNEDYEFLPRSDMLSFEEIRRLAALFLTLGTRKFRLTGGEPLLRRGLETLIGMLAELRCPDGSRPELALTTNASLLARKAVALRTAGLDRVTVSLDAIDDAVFRRMNDADFPVSDVLAGIDAAAAAGLGPIKVNMVVRKGVNDDQILPMIRHFRGTGHVLRFIEFMDVGTSNRWQLDEVLPSGELLQRVADAFGVEPLDPNYRGEVAERWQLADGSLEIGVISSVSQPFCRDCSRARLSTEGRLYTCLFASSGWDLRARLRDGSSDSEILAGLEQVWRQRGDRYSELRSQLPADWPRIEMSYIGG